uniref:Uncharacterized protein n=1 Tax=Strongyloides venezuelensis TaxID=75913 RepID=A0A0K0FFA5_STRVS
MVSLNNINNFIFVTFFKTITEKIENDKETSGPLTAAEKKRGNMDLMNLIIRNIENVEDISNIAKSCKPFNINSEIALHRNENYPFPKSIKHVHLICGEENIDWMANALRNFNHYELESLTLGFGRDSAEFLTADYMKSIVSIMRDFKEIKFPLRYAGVLPSNEYFEQTLSYFSRDESCDIIADINFNVAKCDVNIWASNDPPTREENDALNFNLYENVSLDERIDFESHYPIMNVINNLIKEDEINRNHLLDWPKLNFLCVNFELPDESERGLLDAIDKNIPRKPEQFLLKQDLMIDGLNMWQITIQKNINCASIFNDIFDDSYIF